MRHAFVTSCGVGSSRTKGNALVSVQVKAEIEVAMSSQETRTWTFLTNHAHVLVCIARDSGMRMRDIAHAVGITERAAQSIVSDLINEGYVNRTRIGRRNNYVINPDMPLRHELERERLVGELLGVITPESDNE